VFFVARKILKIKKSCCFCHKRTTIFFFFCYYQENLKLSSFPPSFEFFLLLLPKELQAPFLFLIIVASTKGPWNSFFF
jgi:hypothetical protein